MASFPWEDWVWLNHPVVYQLLGLVVAMIVLSFITQNLQRQLASHISNTALRYKARKILKLAGFLLFFVVASIIFNQELSQFSMAFGVIGAGIAFALQQVILSIAGWVAIIFGGFYQTGDRVLVKGVTGDVIDIGVLRTTLMECGGWVNGDLYNGRIVKVANSAVFESPVYNYNSDFPFLWDEIEIPVRYESNLARARQFMEAAAEELLGEYSRQAEQSWKKMVKKYMIEDANVLPTVTMVADENWVTFTIRYVTDYTLRRGTKDRLFTKVLDRINNSEGQVMIATAAFAITEFPRVEAVSAQ